MADKKLYDLGLVCGRFGHLHLGHINLIEASMNLCNRTLVLVGSAQESNTLRNPFNVETRIELIKNAFSNVSSDTLIIRGLNDLTNEFDFSVDWGGYVKKSVEDICGKFADLMVYGNDESRNKWFKDEYISQTARLILPRNALPISATVLRGMLLINDKDSWKKYTPTTIHNMYDNLRKQLLDVPIYQKIYNEIHNSPKTIDDFISIYKVYEEKDKLEKLASSKNANQ